MNLMVVKDVMLGKTGKVILTGPLLLQGFSRRSEIEQAFGQCVTISTTAGDQVLVHVKAVSVSQAMSGSWQVSLAVTPPDPQADVALDSLVTAVDSTAAEGAGGGPMS